MKRRSIYREELEYRREERLGMGGSNLQAWRECLRWLRLAKKKGMWP